MDTNYEAALLLRQTSGSSIHTFDAVTKLASSRDVRLSAWAVFDRAGRRSLRWLTARP